jgi:hypothetical protein
MRGAWGAFWIALGIHELLVQWGKLPLVPAGEGVNGAMAMWFFTLAAVTAAGALAATRRVGAGRLLGAGVLPRDRDDARGVLRQGAPPVGQAEEGCEQARCATGPTGPAGVGEPGVEQGQ